MHTVLVTGATGCLGSNLIIALIKRGLDVRAFHRPTSNLLTLRGVDVKRFLGDIRDIESLRTAVKGCDTVFHTAGMVSFWKRKREEQMAINVVGTRNVVDACLEVGVSKLVHTSSVAALGHREDGQLVDETTTFNWRTQNGYRYTKHLAELEVLNGVNRGLDATILNPTVIIGPRDVYVHGGQLVRDVKRGRVPAYISGGMNLVNVHDVVAGHLTAAERGRSGERYILGGVNLTHRKVFELAASVLNAKAPRIRAPIWIVRAVARGCEVIGNFTRTEPWISPDLLTGAGKFNWYSCEKAKRELGYEPTSVEQAIIEAYEWYTSLGML